MPLFRVTNPGWTQTIRRLRHFFKWTQFLLNPVLQSNSRTKTIFFIEVDPLLLIPRETVENSEYLRRLCWNQGLPGDFDVS
jgi:hypothetical protein